MKASIRNQDNQDECEKAAEEQGESDPHDSGTLLRKSKTRPAITHELGVGVLFFYRNGRRTIEGRSGIGVCYGLGEICRFAWHAADANTARLAAASSLLAKKIDEYNGDDRTGWES
jgi:hypothetical protein